jgi:chromosome partitioning protein
MLDILGREYKAYDKVPPKKQHGGAQIVSMCNQKGGVGKTTSTLALAGALAEYGRRTLIVDFDPQGAATVGIGVNPYELELTINNLLFEDIDPKEAVVETKIEGIDIIPANIDLSAAEIQLTNKIAREQTLKNVLEPLRPLYDVILIDCQPTLGLLTLNSLTASDGVLIPLATEYFAMRGLALLIDTIEQVRKSLNPELSLSGIFATMYVKRTLHSQEVVQSIYDAFGDKLLNSSISRTVQFPDSTVEGEPITTYAPNSQSAKQYRSLAAELISKGVFK